MTKQTRVIIYVRGHNEELQKTKCRLYAADKGYKVLYTTRHLEDVNLCDMVLVSDPSRISRNKLEYYRIVEEFNKRGIEVKFAFDTNNRIQFVKKMFDGTFETL